MRSYINLLFILSGSSYLAAQTLQKEAVLITGDPSDSGKCRAEVMVHGAAEIQLRGKYGEIRNLSGEPAKWLSLSCNRPAPERPAGLQFTAVDGPGVQQLSADPTHQAAAVVYIENHDGSPHRYAFTIEWRTQLAGRVDRGHRGPVKAKTFDNSLSHYAFD